MAWKICFIFSLIAGVCNTLGSSAVFNPQYPVRTPFLYNAAPLYGSPQRGMIPQYNVDEIIVGDKKTPQKSGSKFFGFVKGFFKVVVVLILVLGVLNILGNLLPEGKLAPIDFLSAEKLQEAKDAKDALVRILTAFNREFGLPQDTSQKMFTHVEQLAAKHQLSTDGKALAALSVQAKSEKALNPEEILQVTAARRFLFEKKYKIFCLHTDVGILESARTSLTAALRTTEKNTGIKLSKLAEYIAHMKGDVQYKAPGNELVEGLKEAIENQAGKPGIDKAQFFLDKYPEAISAIVKYNNLVVEYQKRADAIIKTIKLPDDQLFEVMEKLKS